MLIVDDILLSPVRSILWVFGEVCHAAQEELGSEADRIKTELTELYMMLETGRISEEEFDSREKVLLDRLDQLKEDSDGQDEEEIENCKDDAKAECA